MATPITFNGVAYSVPAFGDVGYAQGPGNLSSYLIALASGVLQASGGLFSLTSQANFGPNFGLTALDFISVSALPATAGVIRLAKADVIDWRNNANTLNLPLGINGTDQLTFNGVILATAVSASGIVSTGTAGRVTVYPATGTTVDDVYVQNAFGIDILIAAQAARSIALEYTIPNPGNAVAAATFALLELAQTFTAIQTFATTVNITATTNQLVLGTTNTITLTSPAPAASRTYTIPDVLAAASFVMTEGNQSINGTKTFLGTGSVVFSGGTTFNNNVSFGANNITNVGSITFNPTTSGIIGTPTNNNASAGYVGEYVVSVNPSGGFNATGVWGDFTSISLTAGDWDVSSLFQAEDNASVWTSVETGISITSGNSTTGLTLGLNRTQDAWAASAVTPLKMTSSIASYRLSLASTTTVYLKYMATFTGATPQSSGASIHARRVR